MNRRPLSLIAAMVLALGTFAASIETDRAWYLAGEPMTVSVTAESQRVGVSAGINAVIAYAELCDTEGMAAGVMISLQGGKGKGVIELSPTLHSGYYLLSVYTRNSAEVSQQLVAVVNPLHKSIEDDIEWGESLTTGSSPKGEGGDYPIGGHAAEEVSTPLSLWRGAGGEAVEAEGHIIQARVKNVSGDQTFNGSQIFPTLSIVGKQIHYFEGKMVNDSTALFYTYGIRGKLPMVLAATTSTGVSLPVEIISPFATLLPKKLPHLVFRYKRSEVEARSIDMQRHQASLSRAGEEAEVVPLAYDETAYGTKPYLSYNLDEYRQFRTVREVLLEYVNCVSNKKIQGAPQLVVYSEQNPTDSSWPTLVLIDGMPVIDTERLLGYDARRIHYINVYSGQYTFGNGIYNGILSFVTRSGQLTNYPVEHNMQYLVYEFPE